MTLFGKILIGLILALSLVFASLSAAVYSAQFNYRKELADTKDRFEAYKVQADDVQKKLSGDIADLQTDAARLKDELDRQTLTASNLTEQNRQLNEEIAGTRTALDVETQKAAIAQQDADARRQEVLSGRQRTADLAQKFIAAETEIAGLTDERFNLTVANEQMAATNDRLLDDIGALRTQLRGLGVEPDLSAGDDVPAPDVTGKVLAVQDRNSAGIKVAISLGSDDGLRVGDELEVVRTTGEGKYIGRIELTEVEYDLAIGTQTIKSPTATIQKGDDVKTRL